jgi:hypothetical protein
MGGDARRRQPGFGYIDDPPALNSSVTFHTVMGWRQHRPQPAGMQQ